MSEIASCPYCGAPARAATAGSRGRSGVPGALGPLYREIRRIREIAEAQGSGQGRGAAAAGETGRVADTGGPGQAGAGDENLSRIADLTREVHELRATVARLRGTTGAGAGRPG